MGRQYVRLTQETTYNVFPTSPAGGTQIDLFLPQSNAMTIRPTARFWEIADAGVGNRLIRKKVGRKTVGGSIMTYLFPTQTAYLLNLSASIGTGTCYDLPSFTVDHAIVRDFNCGIDYRRYTGCKVSNLALAADNTDQGDLWTCKLDVIGSTPVTITSADFATPALSAYPADDPYQFLQTASLLTIGSSRTNYQSIGITIANVIQAFMDENVYATAVQWFGRRVGFDAKLRYKSTADRVSYEAGTPLAVTLGVDNGVTTTTFGFGGQCIIDTPPADDFPLDNFFTQSLHLTSMMDPTASPPTDLTITTTTP